MAHFVAQHCKQQLA